MTDCKQCNQFCDVCWNESGKYDFKWRQSDGKWFHICDHHKEVMDHSHSNQGD